MAKQWGYDLTIGAAADADGISLAQTPPGAGDLTITGALATGGVATMDVARRVLITGIVGTTAADFTITGTNRNGRAISETLAGPVGATTVETLQDFLTVSQVAVSAGTTANITVGTSGRVSGPWVICDRFIGNFKLGFAVKVHRLADGYTLHTVSYDIEHTFEDLLLTGQPLPPEPNPAVFDHPTIVAKTDDQYGAYDHPVAALRATINSHTFAAGVGLQLDVIQGGLTP